MDTTAGHAWAHLPAEHADELRDRVAALRRHWHGPAAEAFERSARHAADRLHEAHLALRRAQPTTGAGGYPP